MHLGTDESLFNVGKAKNCEIRGDMNTVYKYENVTAIGDMNKLVEECIVVK